MKISTLVVFSNPGTVRCLVSINSLFSFEFSPYLSSPLSFYGARSIHWSVVVLWRIPGHTGLCGLYYQEVPAKISVGCYIMMPQCESLRSRGRWKRVEGITRMKVWLVWNQQRRHDGIAMIQVIYSQGTDGEEVSQFYALLHIQCSFSQLRA